MVRENSWDSPQTHAMIRETYYHRIQWMHLIQQTLPFHCDMNMIPPVWMHIHSEYAEWWVLPSLLWWQWLQGTWLPYICFLYLFGFQLLLNTLWNQACKIQFLINVRFRLWGLYTHKAFNKHQLNISTHSFSTSFVITFPVLLRSFSI